MSKNGFSLLELLIVIFIIAMIVVFVVPAYQSIFKKNTATILSSQLLRAINMTRSEAHSRGMAVTLCKSADHLSCSGQWQEGQILFIDEKQKGMVTDPENILYIFNRVYPGVLHWRSSLKRDYLQQLPSELTTGENGTFWYCPPDAEYPAWKIMVNQAGRARLEDGSNKDSLHC